MSSVASIGSANNGVCRNQTDSPEIGRSVSPSRSRRRSSFSFRSVPFPVPSCRVLSSFDGSYGGVVSPLSRIERARCAACVRAIDRPIGRRSNPTKGPTNEPTNVLIRASEHSEQRANERRPARERAKGRDDSSFPFLSLGLGGYGTELENQYPSTDKYRPRLATARAPPRKSRSLFRERTEPSPLFSTPRFLSTSPSFSLLANPFLFPSCAKISSSLRASLLFASLFSAFLLFSALRFSSLPFYPLLRRSSGRW